MLYRSGKFLEAEMECRTVLNIRQRTLGPAHAQTLASRAEVATMLEAQGRYADAEPELRAVLDDSENQFGPGNGEVFLYCYRLAECLRNEGKLQEARELAQRARDGFKASVGAEHPFFKMAERLVRSIDSAAKF